jgi:hypothetical protein
LPCYEVNTISVVLKAADRALLEQAIKSIGLKYARSGGSLRVYTEEGTIDIMADAANTTAQCLPTLNRIRQQYSREVLKSAAQKFRWTASWKTQNRVTLRRY